ncbi:MAG: hypothetical protein ACAI44_17255 [Candidatus Sericytochromatia bacterium]
MSTRYSAYFVSLPLSEAARASLERDEIDVRTDTGHAYACISYEPGSPGRASSRWLEQLSAGGESIYLGVQANVGFFEYQHWQDQRCVRSLEYVDNWLKVEGEPEAWESEAFFSAQARTNFDDYLRDVDQDAADAGDEAWPAEREKLLAVWERQRVEKGLSWPQANDEITAGDLWRFYRLQDPL